MLPLAILHGDLVQAREAYERARRRRKGIAPAARRLRQITARVLRAEMAARRLAIASAALAAQLPLFPEPGAPRAEA